MTDPILTALLVFESLCLLPVVWLRVSVFRDARYRAPRNPEIEQRISASLDMAREILRQGRK